MKLLRNLPRHLQRLHSMTNSFNKYQKTIAESINKVPKLTMLLVTYKCHHRCSFCSVLSPQNIDMPYETCLNLLSDISKHGGELVSFSGGEPFLYPHFYDVVMEAHQYNLNVSVTTAGDLIDRNNVGWVGAFIHNLGLSLHGDTKSHNEITGTKSYNKVIKSLELLSIFAPRTNVSILYTATAKNFNLDGINHLIQIARKYGYSISIARAIKTGRCIKEDMLTRTQLIELIEYISEMKKDGLKIKMVDSVPQCLISKQYKDVLSGCSAGISFGCIDPIGNVKICPQSKESLGMINSEQSLSDIWLGERAGVFRKFDWIDNKCKECDKLAECKSGCHVESDSEGFQSDFYLQPSINESVLK